MYMLFVCFQVTLQIQKIQKKEETFQTKQVLLQEERIMEIPEETKEFWKTKINQMLHLW